MLRPQTHSANRSSGIILSPASPAEPQRAGPTRPALSGQAWTSRTPGKVTWTPGNGKINLQHLLGVTLRAGLGLSASPGRCRERGREGPGPTGARPKATGQSFPGQPRVFRGVSATRGLPELPPPSYPRRLFLLPRPPSLPAGRRGQP